MPTDAERLDWIAAQGARIEFSDYIVRCVANGRTALTYHRAPETGAAEIETKPVALRRSIDALMRRALPT